MSVSFLQNRFAMLLLLVVSALLFFLPVSAKLPKVPLPASALQNQPVRGWDVSYGAVSALSGILTATVSPNPLEVTLVSPKSALVTRAFSIKAQVKNAGVASIENVSVELRLPVGLTIVRGASIQTIKKIPRRRTRSVTWRVSTQEAGEYIVSVDVSGTVADSDVSGHDADIISVNEVRSTGNNVLLNFWRNIFAALFR